MINLNNPINTACSIVLNFKANFYNFIIENCDSNNTDRKQDAEYTRKKKNLIMSQRLAKNHTVKIIKSQIVKKQDHSTLLNSTEVWREKCRTHDPSTREPNKLQYIKDIPRLYVFLRKGMLIFNVSNLYLNISFFFFFFRYIQWRNRESMELKDTLTFS